MKLEELLAGLNYYRRAHLFIREYRLWRLIIIPGVLSLLYLPVVIWLITYWLTPFARHIHENWVPPILQSTLTLILLSIAVWTAGIYLGFLLFRNVIMVLCAPLLGHLAETVDKAMEGIEPAPFSWRNARLDVLRAITHSAISLLISVSAMIACLLIGLIPILGAMVSFVLMTLIQSLLAGVGFADPALERRSFSVSSTLNFARRHRSILAGVGTGFLVLLSIPIVGWFVAPGYGMVAGTIATLDLLHKSPADPSKGAQLDDRTDQRIPTPD